MAFSSISKRDYVLSAVEKHEQYLTRYAARMLGGNHDLAADVVQFAYMKLCEQPAPKADSQLKAWLYTVCRNRVIDLIRKNGRCNSVEPAQMELACGMRDNPQLDAEKREWYSSIRKRIDRLPSKDREVIDLWSHGFKHREIAAITSKNPSTVRVQLHRLIQSLRREMGVDSLKESR